MYARVRKALPELYAFTVCMWLRSRSGGSGQGTPFSYSVPGQANEIVLLEAGHDPMELLINDKVNGGWVGWEESGGWGYPALWWVPSMWTLSILLLGSFSAREVPAVCQGGFWVHRDNPDPGQAEERLSVMAFPFTEEARGASPGTQL